MMCVTYATCATSFGNNTGSSIGVIVIVGREMEVRVLGGGCWRC